MRDPAPHCSPKHQLIFALKHLLYLVLFILSDREFRSATLSVSHETFTTCAVKVQFIVFHYFDAQMGK